MRILIPIENEYYSEAQIALVTKHCWTEPAMFCILHVMEPGPLEDLDPEDSQATLLHEHAQKRREFAHKIVEDVFRALRKKFPSNVIHKDVRIGCPKEVILSTAQKWHADTIVVGSHGKSKLGRMMMGSVSSSILADAKCTVIVVRPPAVVAAPKRRNHAQKVTV